MARKYLTIKEKKTIDLIAKGFTPSEAVLQAYDCKNSRSASVVAATLQKKELFSRELAERKDFAKEIIVSEGKKMAELYNINVVEAKNQNEAIDALKEKIKC